MTARNSDGGFKQIAAAARAFPLERSGRPRRLPSRSMNPVRIRIDLVGIIFLVLAIGCTPRKPVTERDRKEAAHLVSEAQFAMTMREWTRAEELLAKAVRVAPTG